MTNRKAIRRARRIRRTVLTVCLMALVAVLSIGGTIAWLTSTPDPITNTFTVGDVTIALDETEGTDTQNGKSFKMVPGNTIDKDPKVTVEAGSEACYVFVKIEKAGNLDKYISYTMDEAWKELTGVPGVYYLEQGALTATGAKDVVYSVLSGDEVTVNEVTNEDMEAAGTTNPTLTFTAYAIQSANMADEVDAWNQLNDELNAD